jgi:hypothetical protein
LSWSIVAGWKRVMKEYGESETHGAELWLAVVRRGEVVEFGVGAREVRTGRRGCMESLDVIRSEHEDREPMTRDGHEASAEAARGRGTA